MKRFPLFLFSAVLTAMVFCQSLFAEESLLSRYDCGSPDTHLKLPPELKEISGITVTNDGRLFAHDDEKGTVYQLDLTNGEIIKRFSIFEKRWFGNNPVTEDFEDIAVAGSRFYMVTSSGVVYGFEEGEDRGSVEAVRYETFLNDLYDVEGLCHDPPSDALLLACKEYPEDISLRKLLFDKKKSKLKLKPVYSFSLKSMSLDKAPRFILDGKLLKKKSAEKKFKPSAIARHPQSGTFFVLAAKGRLLVEISPAGMVLDAARLPAEDHPQPEGIAFTSENVMVISNEGVTGSATMLFYSMQKPGSDLSRAAHWVFLP